MKKIAIMAALLAVAACDNVNVDRDAIGEKAAAAGKAASDAAQGWLGPLERQPDAAATAEAKAATGETEIGETAAIADQPTPAELTVEQKVEEARRAVTTIIPAGKYLYFQGAGQEPSSAMTLTPEGLVKMTHIDGSDPSQFQWRKVGERVCPELPEDNSIGFCYTITGPDQSGAYAISNTTVRMVPVV